MRKRLQKKVIGSIIRTARKKKGLNQKQVAKLVGLNSSMFLSLVERGLSKAPLQLLNQLSMIIPLNKKKVAKILIDDYADYVKESLLI